MFGDTITAEVAGEYGLVNRVVPAEEVLPAAQEWAARLAAGPTLAISMTKRMLNNEWSMDLESPRPRPSCSWAKTTAFSTRPSRRKNHLNSLVDESFSEVEIAAFPMVARNDGDRSEL
jgi:hypothetical protein